MQKITIVFFGTPEFAVPSLEALAKDTDFEVVKVITNPDRPKGRGQAVSPPDIKMFAEHIGLPTAQPEKLKENTEIYQELRNLQPDFFVVVSYGRLLPKKILEIPRHGAINVHSSLLPKYRGASPIQEALLHGDKETGITFMRMSEGMDAGDILFLKKIAIEEDDNADTLTKKLAFMASQLLPYVLKDIKEGNLKPIPQNHSKASYCSKIPNEAGKIEWGNSAEEIRNKIRALSSRPGTFTTWKNKRLKIFAASTLSDETQKTKKPGELVIIDDKTLAVKAKEGLLIPKIIQLEGKKPCTIEEFLRGYKKALTETPLFE